MKVKEFFPIDLRSTHVTNCLGEKQYKFVIVKASIIIDTEISAIAEIARVVS